MHPIPDDILEEYDERRAIMEIDNDEPPQGFTARQWAQYDARQRMAEKYGPRALAMILRHDGVAPPSREGRPVPPRQQPPQRGSHRLAAGPLGPQHGRPQVVAVAAQHHQALPWRRFTATPPAVEARRSGPAAHAAPRPRIHEAPLAGAADEHPGRLVEVFHRTGGRLAAAHGAPRRAEQVDPAANPVRRLPPQCRQPEHRGLPVSRPD